MGLSNQFQRLKRELGIKRCLIIQGNVNDVYLNGKQKLTDLTAHLKDILSELGYEDIFYWDRVDGLVGNTQQLKLVSEIAIEGESYAVQPRQPNRPGQKFKKPEEIFPLLLKNLIGHQKKKAFILNWSEYLFSGQNLSELEREQLTILGKAIHDRPIDYLDADVHENVIIFITTKLSLLPLTFYQENAEVAIIHLGKPDRLERRALIEKIEPAFDVFLPPGDTLTTTAKANEYIDMLDDFSNKEIIHLAKLSRKEKKQTFDKLFYLSKYGEKDNPWEKLDYQALRNIKQTLKERVVGQDEAIAKIEKVVIKAYMGLTGLHKSSSRSMPKGVLFFVGPTGVGKTELSKALAKFLFGDDQACIRFDMSEYAQENSDQKLIGAPPGYVGYEEGGQLTNAIREKPFSVVLFDEIEKAAKPNPRILDIFLQILEDGRLTDSKGQTTYFSDTIIIFTSNLGASEVPPTKDHDQVAKAFIDVVKNYFDNEIKRPEILGRIGYSNIVPFNFIHQQDLMVKIAKSKLKPIKQGIFEKYKIVLEFEDELKFVNYVLSEADIAKGGRDILNAINDKLLDALSAFLFENKLDLVIYRGQTLQVSFKGKEIAFDFIVQS